MKPAPGSTPTTLKATSCAACRRSKVKCRGVKADGPAFPCARCVRLRIECEDPRTQQEQAMRAHELVRSIRKMLQTNEPPVDRLRVQRLLTMFTLNYRRNVGKERMFDPSGSVGSTIIDMIRTMSEFLGYDADKYMAQLTSVDGGPPGVMVDGHYLTHKGPRTQALHPYLLVLFTDCLAALAMVNVFGETCFYANEAYERAFCTEAEANRLLLEEQVVPPAVASLPIHTSERRRFASMLHQCLLGTTTGGPPGEEHVHIFKVKLRGPSVSVMALVRARTFVANDGSYCGTVISYTPIPMHAVPSKRMMQGVRRSAFRFPDETDPWLECAKAFGDWEEEPEEEEAAGQQGQNAESPPHGSGSDLSGGGGSSDSLAPMAFPPAPSDPPSAPVAFAAPNSLPADAGFLQAQQHAAGYGHHHQQHSRAEGLVERGMPEGGGLLVDESADFDMGDGLAGEPLLEEDLMILSEVLWD